MANLAVLEQQLQNAAAEPVQPELHPRANKLVSYKYVGAVLAAAGGGQTAAMGSGADQETKISRCLGQIKEAEAAAPSNPEETELVAQMRGIAASGAGDIQTATRSFEAAIASGRLTATDQQRLIQTVASPYYQTKDYANTMVWAKR